MEPIEFTGDEKPTRLKQMTLRALSERLITPEKAEELCPGCMSELELPAKAESRSLISPEDLMKLPPSQRRAILAKVAEMAAQEYRDNPELTDFEAFGEDDLEDG